MRNAIQRLPDAEEKALVEVACANGLDRSELGCRMTRQHGEGKGRWKGNGFLGGQQYDISYDLMLCEYCGNLMSFAVCPAKVQQIKDRLLNA